LIGDEIERDLYVAPSAPGDTLPARRAPLFGRANELTTLAEFLLHADERLLTISGVGGCGKTRLALELAADLAPAFPHRLWFVELAPIAAGAPWHEPVLGGSVTVTASASGASASVNAPATLPANGQVSMSATANDTAGGPYQLKANVGRALSVTYTVGTITDHAGGLTSATTCRTATNTTCTLRDALAYALSGTDTVVFKSGVGLTITLGSKLPALTRNVTITGPGANLLTIDGANTVRAFEIASGVTVNLSGVTIANGFDSQNGGAIYLNANATLSVTNSVFANNTAQVHGGAIYNAGTLTLTNSTMSGNHATNADGGGINNSGTLTVTNSTLSGNSGYGGGGISNIGSATVTNSTVSGNRATFNGGGGIFNDRDGTASLTNTIVAGNTTTTIGPDLYGTITTGGHNLFGTTSGATITTGNGDLINSNPGLGPIGNNGGPTQTIPLLSGSPAIAAADPATCAATGPGKVASVDQRGFPRPAACSIGAYEPQTIAPVLAPKPSGGTPGEAPNPLPAARP
jgi:predicted outer membrane repeat protein